ncbi:hypothetical protein NQ317_002377 [Molorchus minor]|uniref:Tyr recombinase domain-containing protein n=1 Tax=Molorchus minor TaxID=1323400 RepID=A0ABQ9IVS9_9CUCU|nr:hypothetical protein NQ317_002377 [Molorchus minor]
MNNCESEEIVEAANIAISNLLPTKSRIFVVTDVGNMLELFRKYLSLRPPHVKHKRLFLYYKAGKCSSQPVGKNTMGKIPSVVASYLKLPDVACYTGHCLRRSSATLLADAGVDITTMKRHAGWKSTTVAEGYVENSIENKTKIANQVLVGGCLCRLWNRSGPLGSSHCDHLWVYCGSTRRILYFGSGLYYADMGLNGPAKSKKKQVYFRSDLQRAVIYLHAQSRGDVPIANPEPRGPLYSQLKYTRLHLQKTAKNKAETIAGIILTTIRVAAGDKRYGGTAGELLLSVGTFSRYGVTILIARITKDNKDNEDKEQVNRSVEQVNRFLNSGFLDSNEHIMMAIIHEGDVCRPSNNSHYMRAEYHTFTVVNNKQHYPWT